MTFMDDARDEQGLELLLEKNREGKLSPLELLSLGEDDVRYPAYEAELLETILNLRTDRNYLMDELIETRRCSQSLNPDSIEPMKERVCCISLRKCLEEKGATHCLRLLDECGCGEKE
jgi:hypothetical protein